MSGALGQFQQGASHGCAGLPHPAENFKIEICEARFLCNCSDPVLPTSKTGLQSCKSLSVGLFGCIGISLRTDNNSRCNVQRKETVEYITTMVKFSLVKRDLWRPHVGSGIILGPIRSSGAVAREIVTTTCIVRKWDRGDAGRCEKNAPRFSTGTASALSQGSTRRRANVDKMTAKQLFSDHSESDTFGAESSGLGTAALAKRGAVCRKHWRGQRTLQIAMTMGYAEASRRRRTVLAGLLCLRAARSSGTMAAPQSSGVSSWCTPRKTDAKGDCSLSDKDEKRGVSRVSVAVGLAKFYDFRTGCLIERVDVQLDGVLSWC